MTDSPAGKLRRLLASDVYTAKSRLRSDDLLVRERAARSLAEASARLASAADLSAVDPAAVRQGLGRLAAVVADRRRYAEIIALRRQVSR